MNRYDELKKALLQNYSEQEALDNLTFVPDADQIDFLKKSVAATMTHIPQKAFNCGQISALWAAMIKDHSTIPAAVICGDLQYLGTKLFVCNRPIASTQENATQLELWDGHCWLEFGGLIADASIFRTLYYGNMHTEIKKTIIERFGEGRGALISTPAQLLDLGFIYTPRYSLNSEVIDGLVKGIDLPKGDKND